MSEEYLNYGECEICHKTGGRIPGDDMCLDCFDEYLDQTQKEVKKCQKK